MAATTPATRTTAGLRRGQLAARAGCDLETVRYYERIGLMPEPARTAAGHRVYGPGDVARLRFVRRCRDLGFTLADIRGLLDLADGSAESCGRVHARTLAHLEEIRGKIAALREMERAVGDLATACERSDGATCPVLRPLFTDSPAR